MVDCDDRISELAEMPGAEMAELQNRLGHQFQDPQLLEEALSHRSWAHECHDRPHYERLEFLGDAVLGLVAVEWLYRENPGLPEGELSRLKGFLVSSRVLAGHARRLGLGRALRLGVGEERSGGRNKSSILADSLEAVIGAVYQDGGYAAAQAVVLPLLQSSQKKSRRDLTVNEPKTALQEQVQALGWELPVYRIVSATGPDHERAFTVECWVRDRCLGVATGASKKEAESKAASQALESLSGDVVAW
jgi:ribonuclease-3